MVLCVCLVVFLLKEGNREQILSLDSRSGCIDVGQHGFYRKLPSENASACVIAVLAREIYFAKCLDLSEWLHKNFHAGLCLSIYS